MRTIAIFNHKGGCGKTTTAINLAATLAGEGNRVLLVDLDSQAHSTIGSGVREDEVELSTYDVIMAQRGDAEHVNLSQIAWEIVDRFFLAPSGVMLAGLEQELAGAEGREARLSAAVSEISGRYDFVLIDCGPGLGLLAVNAICASDEVIIPLDLGFFAVHGLKRALETVALAGRRTGREPLVRVLATLYDSRTRSARKCLKFLREHYGKSVFNTVVRYNVKLKEAASMGSPITEFLPSSRGHRDYRALAQELVSADLEALADVDTLVEEDIDLREEEIDRRIENVYGAVAVRGGVKFVCQAPGAHEVSVAGDFNEWSPDGGHMVSTEVDNVWEKQIEMPDGRHEYRLVIDGRWTSDPANPYVSSNPFGELNSVVEVK